MVLSEIGKFRTKEKTVKLVKLTKSAQSVKSSREAAPPAPAPVAKSVHQPQPPKPAPESGKEGGWISVGDTEIRLSDFCIKSGYTGPAFLADFQNLGSEPVACVVTGPGRSPEFVKAQVTGKRDKIVTREVPRAAVFETVEKRDKALEWAYRQIREDGYGTGFSENPEDIRGDFRGGGTEFSGLVVGVWRYLHDGWTEPCVGYVSREASESAELLKSVPAYENLPGRPPRTHGVVILSSADSEEPEVDPCVPETEFRHPVLASDPWCRAVWISEIRKSQPAPVPARLKIPR